MVVTSTLESTLTKNPKMARTYKGLKARNNLLTQPLKLSHQRVNIDVDLPGNKLYGLTELTIMPATSQIRSVKLDCREMTVKEILVNKRKVNFIYKDMLYINDDEMFQQCLDTNSVNVFDLYNKNITIHQHHFLKQKLNYIFGEGNEDPRTESTICLGNTEELTILLPENMKHHLLDTHSVTPSGHSTTVTPMHLRTKDTHSDYYAPFQILIEYEVINPQNGIRFVNVDSLWHAYTTNSEYNVSTSSWVPCIDNLWEKSTWTMEISIPRTVKDIGHPIIIGTKEAIESRKSEYNRRRKEEKVKRRQESTGDEPISSDDDDYDRDDESQDLMVATGDFVETKEIPHATDLSKKTVAWSIYNPVCAHHIGWTVGCFQTIELPEEEADDGDEDPIDEIPLKVYCLPDQNAMALNTLVFTRMALKYFLKQFGLFPFNSYTIIFVADNSYPIANYAGLTVLDCQLLYPSTLIEPVYTTTPVIVNAIASQWSGINITPQQLNDIWCVLGISGFMTYLFLTVLMGHNETRFKIKQNIDTLVKLDVGKKPVALSFFRFPLSERDLDFIKLKSPLVLYILDKTMTKSDKLFGLHRVLPKLFLQVMSGDLINNTLATQHFQYICEKVHRNRLESFFKQWIFRAGCPSFKVSQRFNRKRGMIEVVVRQVQMQDAKFVPTMENFVDSSIGLLDDEPVFSPQLAFVGPMTIRVHEADGTPYEHVVDLKQHTVRIDINYNSKFRRMKKHKEEAAEGGTYRRFGDIIQSESDLKSWNLRDWDPIDDDELYNNAFEWIRVDTDFEWLASISVYQPDYMYTSQLQYDRDVEAQYEAVKFFGKQSKPTVPYCTTLVRTVMDSRYYYGVRIAALQALASLSKSHNNFMGLPYLIKVYQKLFCFPNSIIPLANDFSDISMFLIQNALPEIFCSIRDEDGNTPAKVRDVLLNMVIYNENTNNKFQDSLYVSKLLETLASSIINKNAVPVANILGHKSLDDFNKTVVSELDRQQKLDEWVPSYHGIISVMCVQQKVRLALYGLAELPLQELLLLTSHSNSDICLQAFEGLLILGGLKNAHIMAYFMHVCLLKRDYTFQCCMVDILIKAIKFAAIHGTGSALDDGEFNTLDKLVDTKDSVIISESSHTRRDTIARKTLKGTIQLLRRDYGVGKGLKRVMWELLHTSLLSIYCKRQLFSICQVLYKEINSFIVDIPIPSVAMNELTRKIVAKNLGDGQILVHREGRFKIQLNPRIVLKKATDKSKVKIKLDHREPTQTPLPQPLRPPSLRTPSARVTIKPIAPPVSAPTPIPVPVISPVSPNLVNVNGSMVTFSLDQQRLGSIKQPQGPRYVKISLRQKKIWVSDSQEFPQHVEPEIATTDNSELNPLPKPSKGNSGSVGESVGTPRKLRLRLSRKAKAV